ncbi:hypothetical protein PL769_001104 [Acinetobacter baumannii]|jgi:hypothetical protein|uniref:Uncharacterized protein n=1 Tax=Acinetobacter baumannii TaxID=470 RepID=A0AAQ1ARS3_ACIBA|nr:MULTISPECIES: hypothetical protein [Acinetobacter]ATU22576.1 hypothetical protein AYP_001295 [Acinetobacter baumannii]AYY16671.1 hypothetical protein EG364_05015 [Acinetobacter sp. FDAARGOS_560]EHU1329327.1 hypothetical protein [Acinetobacter baumannii]EHU1337699.1 hypothetical protein [Acinetobacter baumannii]EHU1346002.1 hypothetical protein [Acinetobacter baumannii]
MSDQVLVVAIKKGFYHGIRDVGTEFYVPAGLVNPKVKTWFKPVEEKPKASGRGATGSTQAE